jgi:hypothetical protein
MYIGNEHVTAHVAPDGTATVFLGLRIAYTGEIPENVTDKAEFQTWVIAVAETFALPTTDATVTVYTSTYAPWEEGADEPELISTDAEVYFVQDYRDQFGDWNENETVWIPASVADTAAHLLSGSVTQFWAGECSSSAGEVSCGDNPWYSDEPYTNPYTGEMEEKSAHLSGFTPAETTEIYAQVKGF